MYNVYLFSLLKFSLGQHPSRRTTGAGLILRPQRRVPNPLGRAQVGWLPQQHRCSRWSKTWRSSLKLQPRSLLEGSTCSSGPALLSRGLLHQQGRLSFQKMRVIWRSRLWKISPMTWAREESQPLCLTRSSQRSLMPALGALGHDPGFLAGDSASGLSLVS